MADQPEQQPTMNQAKEAARQALVPTLIAQTTEIAPTAGAAQVQALVQARFVMALKKPRNWDLVRQDLKKECTRPSFALEAEGHEGEGNSALYRRPVGGGAIAEGLGIRFAEVAERCMGNIMSGALTISEDDKKKTKYCFVLDLETNASWEDTIDIAKIVERQQPRKGDVIISQRVNSQGQNTFTIQATEDALATKEGALLSKKLRTLILRLIPGDIQDECIKEIKRIRREKITEDPDAAKKRIIDGMALQNVTVTMLEEYLDHPVAQCTPAEILNLQGLYGSLRDGITTWRDIMENLEESRKVRPKAAQTTAQTSPAQPAVDKGMDAAKAQAAQAVPPTVQPQAPVQSTVPPATPAENQAVAQQNVPPPATPPAAEPSSTGPAPVWAEQQPVTTLQAPPVTPSQPEVQGLWRKEQAGPNGEPIWVLNQELKGGKGKVVKEVLFPAVLTRDSEAEAWTAEQLDRAESGLAKVNQVLSKNFKLASTVKSWFNIPLEEMNSQAMECLCKVLVEWK